MNSIVFLHTKKINKKLTDLSILNTKIKISLTNMSI